MANLRVVVIEGADHMTAFARPKFVKELREFLDMHRREGKPLAPGKGRRRADRPYSAALAVAGRPGVT
jgi:hypothetical protein